jgi:hypothetical protein
VVLVLRHRESANPVQQREGTGRDDAVRLQVREKLRRVCAVEEMIRIRRVGPRVSPANIETRRTP